MSTRTWTGVGTCRALDTYYVYDGLGRLRHVLPPLLSDALEDMDGIADGDSLMAAYAWSYRYDGHGDCVWKKAPGAEAVEMVYDAGHRLALSRDGNQRERGVWSFCYYDGQGRPAVTGEGAFPDVSSAGESFFRATYDGTGEALGYRMEPALSDGSRLLKITWYDGYGFIDRAILFLVVLTRVRKGIPGIDLLPGYLIPRSKQINHYIYAPKYGVLIQYNKDIINKSAKPFSSVFKEQIK